MLRQLLLLCCVVTVAAFGVFSVHSRVFKSKAVIGLTPKYVLEVTRLHLATSVVRPGVSVGDTPGGVHVFQLPLILLE